MRPLQGVYWIEIEFVVLWSEESDRLVFLLLACRVVASQQRRPTYPCFLLNTSSECAQAMRAYVEGIHVESNVLEECKSFSLEVYRKSHGASLIDPRCCHRAPERVIEAKKSASDAVVSYEQWAADERPDALLFLAIEKRRIYDWELCQLA